MWNLLAGLKICNSCKNNSVQIHVIFPLLFSGEPGPTAVKGNSADVQFALALPGTPVQQLMKRQKLVCQSHILGASSLFIDSLGQICRIT